MMLQDKFAAIENQLKAKLAEARASFAHGGDRGHDLERAVRCVVRDFLPRRLDVGQGEVIDSLGSRSGQTDLVIANEDHPFTFASDSPGIFFVEGVAAAGEIKTVLTT